MTAAASPPTEPALPARLAHRLIDQYPGDAAVVLETLPVAEAAAFLRGRPAAAAATVLDRMVPERTAALLDAIGAPEVGPVLARLAAPHAVDALHWLEADARERILAAAEPRVGRELRELMKYPANSAGALMDPRVIMLRDGETAADALARLRAVTRPVHQVYVVDSGQRLLGAVPIQRLATSAPTEVLHALLERDTATVPPIATREEVVDTLTRTGLPSIAVVDFEGVLRGVLRHRALVGAAADEALADLQQMVGASKDERALSPVGFAVRKRLPWLQINLVTAFLAAAVVGLFEGTIARVTSLAVLLPVVAGQSGNSGAQALAVTMRGLALREVRRSHWIRLASKEMVVGAANGVAVALTTALGVYIWSRSELLAAVIATAMVLSMAIAGIAGASIPILLKTFGLDPAQSSTIILTTVTDVVGFLSFLGLATLLASQL